MSGEDDDEVMPYKSRGGGGWEGGVKNLNRHTHPQPSTTRTKNRKEENPQAHDTRDLKFGILFDWTCRQCC